MSKNNNGITIAIIISVGLFFTVLTVILYNNYKDNQRYQRDLYIQEQEALKEKQDREQKELDESMNRVLYNTCINSAFESYQTNWNTECKSQGLKDNCRLPLDNVDIIDGRLEEAKKDCKDQYL